MPKLLIINVSCNQGSTGTIAEQIGLMMQANGWDVYFAHGARYIGNSHLKTYQIQNKWNEYLHASKSLLFDADGYGSTIATQKLIRFINQIQPDIIHLHNIHGYYINFKLLFKYLNSTGIPIVITLHDCWTFTGHCTHFVTANCGKWRTGCERCPQIHSVPKSLFLDRSKNNYISKMKWIGGNQNLHFVCVSGWMESVLKQSMYKHHPIHLINNGIDINIFKPAREKNHIKFSILGVSNQWTKSKGLYDFFKLRELLAEDEYEISLVGLSSRQINILPSGINGIVSTNNKEELAKLYSSSNVFINPTYADTFPTTNLEALACGTPVITYNTGGSPESVNSKCGCVVQQGDVLGLVNEIIEMKNNPKSSDYCRTHAINNYDKNICLSKYHNLFLSLIF